MKRLLVLVIILSAISPLCMYSQGLSTAKEYGESMKQWSVTENDKYRSTIERICDGKKSTRIADDIARDLAHKNGVPDNSSYLLDSYLNWIEKAMLEGITIEFSDFKAVNRDEIEGTTFLETKYARMSDKDYVSCRIKINGALSYDVYDLICMRDGKITKISRYEKSGNKIKLDFSDIMDMETWGVSYNYGKNWPIGLSANYSYSWFMIGVDVGINTDKDKLYKHNLEMTDVMNYTKEDIEYDPLFFLTVTPSVYLKYVSIGCGIGFLYMDGKKNIAKGSSKSYSESGENTFFSYTVSSSYTTEESCSKVKFMLRPSIKGFIPLTDEMSLSLSVGYDYAFGYKEKNGINFGLGLQFELW